jgi:hypothetical protein
MASLPITLPKSVREDVLRRHGFKSTPGGWQRAEIAFGVTGSWLVFTAPALQTSKSLPDLGAVGLWKSFGHDGQAQRVFAVREDWIRDDDLLLADEDRSLFDYLVEWALATAHGSLPVGWAAPERARIDACLDKGRLTLVHRSFTRQMQILDAPDRLALRLPLLLHLPATLPEARWHWLRALLLEAQNTHHLFRLGFAREGTQTSVIAEVDLTGVPLLLLELLISTSCDALRWVVARLIESADFLAQADVASRALEICAAPHPKPTGEPKHDHDH